MQPKARNVSIGPIATATDSNSSPSGSTFDLTPGARLKGCWVGAINAGLPPMSVSLNVLPEGTQLGGNIVAHGIIRGQTSGGGANYDSVGWTGDIPLGQTPKIFCLVRNDTGSTQFATLSIIEEIP